MDTLVRVGPRPRRQVGLYQDNPSATDLFTLADLREVETVAAASEGFASRMIAMASAYVRNAIGFDPWTSSTRKGRFSGDGTAICTLGAWPITAVTKLEVGIPSLADGGSAWSVLLASATSDAGEDVLVPLHGRYLQARYRVFPEGAGNIYAEYTAGWATLPADLVEAAITICRLGMMDRAMLGKGSETIGPVNIQQVLRRHREYPLIVDTLKRYALEP